MNIRFLETFVWLSRLNSFSRTAEKLNATQPAISGRIQKLEELLNVRLYDRTAKGFSLTPAARRLLEHAERIVDIAENMQKLAGDEGSLDTPLRIGVIELVTLTWLPAFVALVREHHPQAVLEVRTEVSRLLIEELKDGELDLVFVVGPIAEPGIQNMPIGAVAVDWMANPAVFDCAAVTDIVSLSHMPIVMGAQNSSGREQLVEYFHRYGIIDVPSRTHKLRLDVIYSLATAAQVVRSGMGVAALPVFMVADDLKNGSVARLPVRQSLSPFDVVGCYKAGCPSSQLVTAMIALALEAADIYAREVPSDAFRTYEGVSRDKQR